MLLAVAGLATSTWLGPEWAVSRYQDWQKSGERIECVDRTLPARTAHFLPLRLNPQAAPVGSTVKLRIRMELLAPPDGAAWSLAPTIEQGITTWTSRLVFGPFDCAIISDRMFKESASVAVPGARVRNGFATADGGTEGVDARAALCAESVTAPLLGQEQEEFLAKWAGDPIASAPARLLLSQSPFAGAQTLPTGKDDGILPTLEVLPEGAFYPDDSPAADTDSNGWPVAARNRAVGLLQRAGALHIAGDQHLSSVIRYGHAQGDPIVFTVPAMANASPRHWAPSHGNPITVMAVANPARTDRTPRALAQLSPGFALIRYEPAVHELVLEAWPRVAPPPESSEGDSPFAGWPLRVPLAPRSP